MTMKTPTQHVAHLLLIAKILAEYKPQDSLELKLAAEYFEKSQDRIVELEKQQIRLEAEIRVLQVNSGFEKVAETQIKEKAKRFDPSSLVLINWHDIFADFEPHQKEEAFVALQADYTIGGNAGILISVWDVLKIYSSLNGCDHRVLKALANCSFVVYRA